MDDALKHHALFDEFERRLDQLLSKGDNEAMRHDLIIRPLLIDPAGLGWQQTEVASQQTLHMPKELTTSYVWKGATPRNRRPDMIIVPQGYDRTVAVIEEKTRHTDLASLERVGGQVKEYQFLHNAVWGLVTDAEKWILWKNNEVFHRFSNLADLRRNFPDLRNCIGRNELLKRLRDYGTSDLVIVRDIAPRILVVGSPHPTPHVPTDLIEFLTKPSTASADLLVHLVSTLRIDLETTFQTHIRDYDLRESVAMTCQAAVNMSFTRPVAGAELLRSKVASPPMAAQEAKSFVSAYSSFSDLIHRIKTESHPLTLADAVQLLMKVAPTPDQHFIPAHVRQHLRELVGNAGIEGDARNWIRKFDATKP